MNDRITNLILVSSIFCFTVMVTIFVIIPAIYNCKTHSKLEEAARIARHEDLKKYTVFDAWGNETRYERYISETRNSLYITYRFTSSGRDGIFCTKDDITACVTDYNKSIMIGKWVGNRSKEFAIGIKKGLAEKSKFNYAIKTDTEE